MELTEEQLQKMIDRAVEKVVTQTPKPALQPNVVNKFMHETVEKWAQQEAPHDERGFKTRNVSAWNLSDAFRLVLRAKFDVKRVADVPADKMGDVKVLFEAFKSLIEKENT